MIAYNSTLKDLLDIIIKQYGDPNTSHLGLRKLFTQEGKINPSILIFHNSQHIVDLPSRHLLSDGDEVGLFYAISGG